MDYNNSKFIDEFCKTVKSIAPQKVFFVCSASYDRYGYRKALDGISVNSVAFTEFEPCPEVSSVMKGIEMLNRENCDFIVAVGGGSAIDTAKGIKYYAKINTEILAVPTTAGTGAEVTRFSVLYKDKDKESVSSYDIIPEYQIFDYCTLKSLPFEQKTVTALDAFSHSVEAFWSTDATAESREYSKESLKLFNDFVDEYLTDTPSDKCLEAMMKASELAGRAINIARTTAAHAFSYKLHKLKGLHHGHAVAICLAYIWQYMKENGSEDLLNLIDETEIASGFNPHRLLAFMDKYGLETELTMTSKEFNETVNGVNVDRLGNHPMKLSGKDILSIYKSFINAD